MRHAIICALILLFIAWCAPARAEDLETSPSSVKYLPLDEDVREEFAGVDKLIAQQDWRRAIDICQKHIVKPSKSVVKLSDDVYGSVRALCMKKLREMPAPAKLLYRTLYDPDAERLYRRAFQDRDLAAARTLATDFAMTTQGPNGLDLLGSLLFERGDFQGAVAAWSEWAQQVNPEAVPEAARRTLAAKMALAAARAADPRALEKAVALFGPKGSVVDLADGTKLARPDQLEALTRAVPPSVLTLPGAPDALDFTRWQNFLRSPYSTRMAEYYGGSRQIRHSCLGDLSGGVLYVNTPEGPSAFDALTGRLIWNRPGKNYDSEYYESLRSFNFYARVAPVSAGGKKTLFVTGGSRLGAYDAESGAPLWAKTAPALAKMLGMLDASNLHVAFSSPVACRGRTAYVMAETSRAEVHLLAFSPANGSPIWSTPIGGGTPRSNYRISFPSAVAPDASGVFFCNGQGLIGRCDAATGEIAWLVPYRRGTRYSQERNYDMSNALNCSPLAVVAGTVICFPSDGPQLLALSATDGRQLWRKDALTTRYFLGAEPPEPGAAYARIYLAGTQVECLRSDNGSTLWTWPLPEDAALGLGCVTPRGVLAATNRALYLIDRSSGELVSSTPVSLLTSEAVNVLSDRDSVALVSGDRLYVVGAKAATRTMLQEAMTRAAGDPWTMAAQARLLASDGKNADAIALLIDAARLARKKQAGARLAPELDADLVELYDKLRAEAWNAGRRLDGFDWMMKALLSPARAPYECRLGYRKEAARDPNEGHVLTLYGGSTLSGRLDAIESGTVDFTARGEQWHIAAGGVRQILLAETSRPAGSDTFDSGGVVLTNGDRISGRVESVRDGTLLVRAAFADVSLKLSDVAVLVFPAAAAAPPDGTVYVRVRNGDILNGVIRAFDGSDFLLDTPACGTHRIPVDDVVAISNRESMPSGWALGARRSQTRPTDEGETEVPEPEQ